MAVNWQVRNIGFITVHRLKAISHLAKFWIMWRNTQRVSCDLQEIKNINGQTHLSLYSLSGEPILTIRFQSLKAARSGIKMIVFFQYLTGVLKALRLKDQSNFSMTGQLYAYILLLSWDLAVRFLTTYRKTSNISRTSVGNKIVDNSDVVGASPVGAAPTTSSFSTEHLVSMHWAKTTARGYKKHLSFGIWCDLY